MLMKKTLLVILALVMTLSASAQDTKLLNWGVEAGLNFNSLSFDKSVLNSSNRTGFFVGPKLKVNVPLLGFGADVAVLYSLNSARVERGSYSKAENLSYLEIPLNLRYSFGLKVLSVYVATGPQFNYCLSGMSSISDLFAGTVNHMTRSSWGWNVGAGVELFNHLQVGVTYTIPISDVSVSGVAVGFVDNFKQKTVKVRLAYYF